MRTQTRTELTTVSLKATILWLNVGPSVVTGVVGTNTHKCVHTRAHIHTSYVHASVPGNKAERGQWGLMVLQLEHLTVPHKVSFSLTFSCSTLPKPVSCFSFTFSNSLYILFFFKNRYFSGDLLYIPLFWVVCVIEPGSDEEWRHLGFYRAKKSS